MHWFSQSVSLKPAAGEINSLTSAAEICLLTPVESKEALITQDFLKTVKAVFVHQLPDNRAGATLILHAGLHQVYRVHRSGSHSYKWKQLLGLKESTIKRRICKDNKSLNQRTRKQNTVYILAKEILRNFPFFHTQLKDHRLATTGIHKYSCFREQL